jgi:hypothetical protein
VDAPVYEGDYSHEEPERYDPEVTGWEELEESIE